MRSMIRLPSLLRCQLCHNIFRFHSATVENLPFLNVVTNSTIVGRPFLERKNVYVQHPVYNGLSVLIDSPDFQFDPFSLVEVEVAPLRTWLMKERDGMKQVTVSEYLSKNLDPRLQKLDLDKVYLSDLTNCTFFFDAVIPVGKLLRKLSSLRSDNVWYFGGLREAAKHKKRPKCPSFAPDDMLEPEKKLKTLPVKDIPVNSDVKCFYNVSQNKFALLKNLPPEKLRNKMRSDLLKRYNVLTKPHENLNISTFRSPTEKELSKRRDFRSECVFSIDPPTARDLDDALHVKQLSSSRLQVGVHIADVSFFVPSKSSLCYSAMIRGTSFYLGDEVIPMLPSALSDDLCSLHPGSPKLTLSVVFDISTSDGTVLKYWIGESIISSAAKFSYTQANEIIESDVVPDDVQLHGNHSKETIVQSIQLLQTLSEKLRHRRKMAGALTFAMTKTEPYFLDDADAPVAFAVKQYGKSSMLIEEFMLLANMTVAEFLQNKLPNQAVLRRHPEADEIDLLFLQRKSEKPSKMSAIEIMKLHEKLLKKYAQLKSKSAVADLKQVLSYFAIRSMYPAEYVMTDIDAKLSHYFHFGLQVPLYTHFTSPIRRFADLVVHYQVKALLHTSAPPDRVFLLRSIAISNQKRTAARRLSREMLQFHVWNALMVTGSVFSKVLVISFSKYKMKFYSPTFEMMGDLVFNHDKSILKLNQIASNHLQLTVLGCKRCQKNLKLDVGPLTELYCYLSPGKNMEVRAALAHTITCPSCAKDEPKPVRRSISDVESIDHEAAINAPLRGKKDSADSSERREGQCGQEQ